MEYFGETSKLTRILSNERLRTKAYGRAMAVRIRQRLEEMTVAHDLSQLSHLPPTRLHKLQGRRAHQFDVDISPNWRMIIEGYDEHDVPSTVPSAIVTVSIISIEDYH
ncbi:type II toxin-antitoxin system RelE/ParE family toxin [Lacticaseibacillus kribbianus]|uniref:type II toxin-antitoxin system RelE/ParE family toxin n=1 Tax=Lacticaseibacillus kribbianus TaxID=2926292 RepID=UPI001CD77294|nr:plasmid maintenance system killer protein [Lacticaseibacillus kribbianus]